MMKIFRSSFFPKNANVESTVPTSGEFSELSKSKLGGACPVVRHGNAGHCELQKEKPVCKEEQLASPATPSGDAPEPKVVRRRSEVKKTLPEKTHKDVNDLKIDCTKRVPLESITFDMVNLVINSWESKIRTIPHWAEVTGELFLRKMFELDPETISMFGFPSNTRYNDPRLRFDEKFMTKAIRLIEAIDIAVGFLGPDVGPLEETLFELGGRHVARKCKPHHWPMVGAALFDVFDQCLGPELTYEIKEAWTVLYNFMGYHMIRGLLAKCPELAEGPAQAEGK